MALVVLNIAACVIAVLVEGLALIARACRSLRDEIGSVPDNCP